MLFFIYSCIWLIGYRVILSFSYTLVFSMTIMSTAFKSRVDTTFHSGKHNNNLPFQAGLRPCDITKESEKRSARHPVRSRVPSIIMWTRKLIKKVSFLFAETRIKIGRAYGSIRFTDKPGSEEWATTSGPLEKNEAETYIRTLLFGQALVMIRSWRKWASYQLLCYSSTCLSEAMS